MLWTMFLSCPQNLVGSTGFFRGSHRQVHFRGPLIGSFSWVALGVCCRLRLVVLLAPPVVGVTLLFRVCSLPTDSNDILFLAL